jgi:hypothetical protein
VEGADPHPVGPLYQAPHALPHLPGRLVGEGHSQQPVGPDLALGDQVGDPGREHAGLAAARPGEDEERSLQVLDSLALRRVQTGDQLVEGGALELGGGHCRPVYRAAGHPWSIVPAVRRPPCAQPT